MKVLLTAFEPFGGRPHNSSQMCLNILKRSVTDVEMVSHVWPVAYEGLQERVETLLRNAACELAIHLGQSGSEDRLKLEMFAHNTYKSNGDHLELTADGEYVYQTSCPLENWVKKLKQDNVPAFVSRHAGLIQCNALYYWSLRFIAQGRLKTSCCFIHVPLDPSQRGSEEKGPILPVSEAARGISLILREVVGVGVV